MVSYKLHIVLLDTPHAVQEPPGQDRLILARSILYSAQLV